MAAEIRGNPDDLRRAGREWLPDMASTFKKAASILDDTQPLSFNRAVGLGTGPYGPWNEWLKLRGTLSDILIKNAASLDEGGACLWRIADDLQDIDTGSAQRSKFLQKRADEAGTG